MGEGSKEDAEGTSAFRAVDAGEEVDVEAAVGHQACVGVDGVGQPSAKADTCILVSCQDTGTKHNKMRSPEFGIHMHTYIVRIP